MFAGPKDAKVYLVFDYLFTGDTPTSFTSNTVVAAFNVLLANGINPAHCRMAFASPSNPGKRLMSDLLLTKVGDVKADPNAKVFTKNRAIPGSLLGQLDRLRDDIESAPRDLLITFGLLAAQAIRSNHSVDSQHKWRGSMLDDAHCKRALPTLSPADWMVDQASRFLVQQDIRRAVDGLGNPWEHAQYNFSVCAPNRAGIDACLALIPTNAERISVDIETESQQITSIAIAWSHHDAICIPFIQGELVPYFEDASDEAYAIYKIAALLRVCPQIGQNYNYDRQYFAKNWGVAPPCIHDTMVAQHVLLNSSLGKDLATLASMHCKDYIFWKDENKNRVVGDGDDYSHWIYNCKDAAYTFEIADSQVRGLIASNLYFQFMAWMRATENAYVTMLRGTRHDTRLAYDLTQKAEAILTQYARTLDFIVPQEVHEHSGKGDWFDSPKCLTELFYTKFGQPENYGKQKQLTADAEAMEKIAAREPLLSPLVHTILDQRRIAKNVSTYLKARPDRDGRMRTMYQTAGPITYRLASQITAFDTGMNLQNLSKGEKHAKAKHNVFGLPYDIDSVKQLFIPDPDYYIIDVDLEQADARVVAWDSQSEYLMGVFNTPGADLHTENAKLIFGDPAIDKKHPLRQRAKAGVHAVNYKVMAITLAKTLGITIEEAQHFINAWFEKNPAIKEWHKRVEWEVNNRGYVENVFGYRRYFLDRHTNTTMSEAVSWSPQSTVAIYINLVWDKIVEMSRAFGPQIHVLLQVHDSLVLQCKRTEIREALALVRTAFTETTCPYRGENLIIACGKPEISLKSWDNVKAVNWDLTPITA